MSSSSYQGSRQPSEKRPEDVDGQEDQEIELEVAVGPEEDEESDAATGEGARHQRAGADDVGMGEVEVTRGGGDRTVRNQPESGPEAFAEDRAVQGHLLEGVHAEIVDRQFHCAGDDEDENEDFGGVHQRRHDDALVLVAAAVAVFAELVDIDRKDILAPEENENSVDGEADDHRKHHLESDDLGDQLRRRLLAQHDRDQFVGRGEEDRDQGADGDDSAGIERSRGGGESALGKRACGGPDEGPDRASALEKSPKRAACMRFNPLQDQVSDEQEGKKLQLLDDEFNHAGEIASLGQAAAHAPQSTHLSASIV